MSSEASIEQPSVLVDSQPIAGSIAICNEKLEELEHEENAVDPNTPFDRSETLDVLNKEFDKVPFEPILKELPRLVRRHGMAKAVVVKIENEIDRETRRLDAFARSLPSELLEQGATAASEKISEIEAAQAPFLKDAQEKLAVLAVKLAIARDAAALLSRPWYVASENRPQDQSSSVDQQQLEDDDPENSSEYSDQAKETTPEQGPYAELADKIPTLSDRLAASYSAHQHIYGEVETNGMIFERVYGADSEDIPDEEAKVAYTQVNVVLSKFIPGLKDKKGQLKADHPILKVYTPNEIHTLQQRLRAFSPKSRADFDGLENRILQTAEMAFNHPEMQIPKELESAIERMHKEAPGRVGLQWGSLEKFADMASDAIRQRMRAGGKNNLHLKDYIFEARDTSGTDPDFSYIYRFIGDEFALEAYAKRMDKKSEVTSSRFESNYQEIISWYKENEDLINQVPKSLRLAKRRNGREYFRYGKLQFNAWSAVRSITGLIEDIGIRRDETGDPKVPRHKPVSKDYQGALNAQFVLGHMVDELIERLRTHGAEPAYTSEEIAPLE